MGAENLHESVVLRATTSGLSQRTASSTTAPVGPSLTAYERGYGSDVLLSNVHAGSTTLVAASVERASVL
jgi:hypothetical protein